MCGIIAIKSSSSNVIPEVINLLKKLEYRGYDSSGIGALMDFGIRVVKSPGAVLELEKKIDINLKAKIAIGHTRWATHGAKSEENAHPHASGRLAIVHNGIIENYQEIKKVLISEGEEFYGQTDTEIASKLYSKIIEEHKDIKTATEAFISKLDGSFAIVAMLENGDIIAIKKGITPLAIGFKDNGDIIICSDLAAAASIAEKVLLMKDGDFYINSSSYNTLFDRSGIEVKRDFISGLDNIKDEGLMGYPSFTLKEIHQQPEILKILSNTDIDVSPFKSASRVTFVASGTSYHAGLFAAYLFEKYCGITADAYIASEFLYKRHVFDKNEIMVVISQSGETADCIKAIDHFSGGKIIALVNNIYSNIASLADIVIPIGAGKEVGVASTKAFTAQCYIFMKIAYSLNKIEGKFYDIMDIYKKSEKLLATMPPKVESLVSGLLDIKNILLLGRGIIYPVSLEAALKIKELAYIHAEALPSGEIKHGPLALVSKDILTIIFAPDSEYINKDISTIEEVSSRESNVLVVTNVREKIPEKNNIHILDIDSDLSYEASPIAYVIAMQLIAYIFTVELGNSIDRPRNLAKSVTVE